MVSKLCWRCQAMLANERVARTLKKTLSSNRHPVLSYRVLIPSPALRLQRCFPVVFFLVFCFVDELLLFLPFLILCVVCLSLQRFDLLLRSPLCTIFLSVFYFALYFLFLNDFCFFAVLSRRRTCGLFAPRGQYQTLARRFFSLLFSLPSFIYPIFRVSDSIYLRSCALAKCTSIL